MDAETLLDFDFPMNFTRRYFLVLTWALGAFITSQAAEPASADGKIRIVLVGDSTVASKSGWGDAFGKRLGSKVECLNEAAGGRSSKSFRSEGRWKKALEDKPAWVLIQFGHNDMPGKGPARETDPATTFPENLARYVDEARAIGAKPVLITSLTRRNYLEGKLVRDLTGYVEATKRVAAEKQVPLVDLNARSIEQLEKLGPAGVAEMEPTGKTPGTSDHTHLNERGGELVAALVVEELRKVAPELARLIADEK
jgi:lysophospholipase L1-like esterase